MPLRLIEAAVLDQLGRVLLDDGVEIASIDVRYQNYRIRADSIRPASSGWREFTWQHSSLVWDAGAQQRRLQWLWLPQGNPEPRPGFDAATGRDPILQLDTAPGEAVFMNVPLARLYQDETYLYWGFRLGNGASGRNRWFGRLRKAFETRPKPVTDQLGVNIRHALEDAFPGPENTLYPEGTSGTPWLVLERVPLADLAALPDPVALKTRLLASLLQAVVIGEELRDRSFLTPLTTTVQHPLNQILFGPPGTGKTYQSIAYAVAIIEGKDPEVVMAEARTAVKKRFDNYYRLGQVRLVTFHQAFSYEDFVEGIKPVLAKRAKQEESSEEAQSLSKGVEYTIEQGVFLQMCEKAETPVVSLDDALSSYIDSYAAATSASPVPLRIDQSLKVKAANVGTGLTFDAPPERIGRYGSTWATLLERNRQFLRLGATVKQVAEFLNTAPQRNWEWLTYRDFVLFLGDNGYEFLPNDHFRRSGSQKPFVLIIDEINRGNIAAIFGELITLLEEDKRAGAENEISVVLPYSKADFVVPPNLYLLGTMNTADRSVEALDTALRRRFSFVEMPPLSDLLPEDVAGINLRKLLTVVNERLEMLLDRDHQLGHAWLMGAQTLDDVREAFERKLIPQLQEYFFGNWARIGAVLGNRFVQQTSDGQHSKPFGAFLDEDGEAELKKRYRITDRETWDAVAFRSIYGE